MFDISVTRWQNGFTNARDSETLSDLPIPNRMKVAEYSDDFFHFVPDSWGELGFAQIAADKGIVQGTGFLKPPTASFLMNLGFRMWADFLFAVNALTGNLRVGLFDAAATISNTVTDGIYLRSAGTAALDVVAVANSVQVVQTNVAQLVNPISYNHPITFQVYWDGGVYASAINGRLVWEISGPGVGQQVRGSFGGSSLSPLPAGFPRTTLLAPGIGSTAPIQIDKFAVYKDRINVLMSPRF